MMKKITLTVTVLFFTAMLLLTFLAQSIHNASLPKVAVARLESRMFEVQMFDADGESVTAYTDKIALPKELCEDGVYVLYTAKKNGTERQFVHLISLQTGDESEDGYLEVVAGLISTDRIVIEHSGNLFDGCEVIEIR